MTGLTQDLLSDSTEDDYMKPPQIKRKLFVRWLESQPDDRKFNFFDTENCLICCYFREVHGVQVSVGGNYYDLPGGTEIERFPAWLAVDGIDGGAVQRACREGLRRFKDFLRDQPVIAGGP